MSRSTKGRRPALLAGLLGLLCVATGLFFFRQELRLWWVLQRLSSRLDADARFESLGRNAQGYPEFRHATSGVVFVLLPGGEFLMGGSNADELPVHEVRLSPFLIGKYEVRQTEWSRVMKNEPSVFRGRDLPVEAVSWEDCVGFCDRIGAELPTEAQWEYACSAGTRGYWSGSGPPDAVAWHRQNSAGRTHPVGAKPANGFGLHDMHGNVFEWCEDVYDAAFYGRPEATETDPVCRQGSTGRVLRGGSVFVEPDRCGSASRATNFARGRGNDIGFRPVFRIR